MSKGYQWRKIGKDPGAIGFLQAREPYCVAAAARFLHACDHGWFLQERGGGIRALLIHSKRTLFPVFNGRSEIPLPHFMEGFLRKIRLHAVQGVRREVETLETGLASLGILPVEQVDYDLMALDTPPNPKTLLGGPRKLLVRTPQPADQDALFQLQAGYEQEEVLPQGSIFNPAVCRLSLEHIIAHERILMAELEGRIVGKINTNAASFSRYQIGGVYVQPEYRGLGIASRLCGIFVGDLIAGGKGVTLFVKKQNTAARRVYQRLGFVLLEQYRISYY